MFAYAAAVLGVLLSAALHGCGGGGGGGGPTPSPSPAPSPGPPSPSPGPPSPSPGPAPPSPPPKNQVMHATQTAYLGGGNPDLLKKMPDRKLEKFDAPTDETIVVDRTAKFQEMLGFGGAFTEAAADNWLPLSPEDRAQVIQLYFGDPEDNGHGYTIGRVPMGSCDFTKESYSFNDVDGDVDMAHFDNTVNHDEVSGMLPMILAAQALTEKRKQRLKVYASPWSPPAWMKLPVDGKHSMTGSATPNGLDPKYQAAWAKYFSKFIDAYKAKGVDLWGVTVQNEPEFPAPWEACAYTPEFEAAFLKDHLGPLLRKDHPDVKIMGFDHNKDHVVTWAKVLYKPEFSEFLDGVGVHWYGGLNTEHLNATHNLNPDKFILATEACNCGGVKFKDEPKEWWSRAEKIAIDILEDIKWWSVGWTDWNLVLDTKGGPNHLGNLCDANIIIDPSKTVQGETIILQASYYYMGHFSRFIPPGSRRLGVTSTVKNPPLTKDDVIKKRLKFVPCSEGNGMTWSYDTDTKALKEYGLCAELDADAEGIVMVECTGDKKQQWLVEDPPPGFTPGFKQVRNQDLTDRCVTSKVVGGPVVGLDPGVDVEAGLAEICGKVPADELQMFEPIDSGEHKFPEGFRFRTKMGNCLIPVGADTITFDAVAFETPTGDVSIVAMNLGNHDITYNVYDAASQSGVKDIVVPAHGIHSYVVTAETAYEVVM